VAADFLSPDTAWTSTYSAASNETTFTAPISCGAQNVWSCCVRAQGSWPETYIPPIVSATSTGLVLKGNFTAVPMWFGVMFASSFQPTEWFYRDQQGKPQHDGRLSAKKLKVDLKGYSYLRAQVAKKGRTTKSYAFESMLQDDPWTPLDAPPSEETFVMKVPLGCSSKDVQVVFVSDQWLDFQMPGYEFRGDWNPRGSRHMPASA
jgi:hypothetical protein